MKKTLFITLALITTMIAVAQPTWTIRHNNKVVLTVKKENEQKNIIRIKKADLDKPGSFQVSFVKTAADSAWGRSVMITDSTGNTIAENLDAGQTAKAPIVVSFPLVNKAVKELLLKHKKIKIYTIAIPTDPAKAAAVRVRRVHVCTVELK
jgi:hypothetical protein